MNSKSFKIGDLKNNAQVWLNFSEKSLQLLTSASYIYDKNLNHLVPKWNRKENYTYPAIVSQISPTMPSTECRQTSWTLGDLVRESVRMYIYVHK